ncbi:hypothetical protein PHJA_002430600 [Phtheirospermum japonicum]|uniref:Retrotransposon Copia-like N-terminal domain-containing protein n=1 Tax=Phtheirospermum japonicum TaxID=374723 RepID=A0A830CUN1_9LAMI|nr:hypothetical protein PHJA_002430600 [Phtheirospermum japonicum]
MFTGSSNTTTTSESVESSPLDQINAATHLTLRLTTTNYVSWKLQFTSLFFGLDLIGFLDGSAMATPTTLVVGTEQSPNPAWKCQDQLILHRILAFLIKVVIPLIASATSSSDAWTRLNRIFSNRPQSHIIHLKDKLSSIQRGTLPISDILLQIKTLSDELSTLGAPLSNADLLIYCTRGLGPAYKEVIAALRTRDTRAPFEELFDKLIDHETYFHDSNQSAAPIFPSVHYTAASTQAQPLAASPPSRGSTYVAPRRSPVPTSSPGLLPSPMPSPQSVPLQHQ